MSIYYLDTKDFDPVQLQELFLSVNWNSGNYPEKLQLAMKNSDSVISAWKDNKLVGLMSGISDGVMTVYFHWLLVRPEFQGQGIGQEIMRRMLARYETFITRVLVAYTTQAGFYERCGFSIGTGSTPMYLTSIAL